jgi:hypothetical protein
VGWLSAAFLGSLIVLTPVGAWFEQVRLFSVIFSALGSFAMDAPLTIKSNASHCHLP